MTGIAAQCSLEKNVVKNLKERWKLISQTKGKLCYPVLDWMNIGLSMTLGLCFVGLQVQMERKEEALFCPQERANGWSGLGLYIMPQIQTLMLKHCCSINQ